MQGRAEMEESMTEHRKWSGEKERCDRIFGGKRMGRIRRKKESGRQKPESDRHRWHRYDCPNLHQVLV